MFELKFWSFLVKKVTEHLFAWEASAQLLWNFPNLGSNILEKVNIEQRIKKIGKDDNFSAVIKPSVTVRFLRYSLCFSCKNLSHRMSWITGTVACNLTQVQQLGDLALQMWACSSSIDEKVAKHCSLSLALSRDDNRLWNTFLYSSLPLWFPNQSLYYFSYFQFDLVIKCNLNFVQLCSRTKTVILIISTGTLSFLPHAPMTWNVPSDIRVAQATIIPSLVPGHMSYTEVSSSATSNTWWTIPTGQLLHTLCSRMSPPPVSANVSRNFSEKTNYLRNTSRTSSTISPVKMPKTASCSIQNYCFGICLIKTTTWNFWR